MRKLSVTGCVNEGTQRFPSGFIFFDDGVRISFEPGTSGLGNPFGLFPLAPMWPQPKNEHYDLATAYLICRGLDK